MADSVILSNGHKMPLVGLGTWQVKDPEELTVALEVALELGYRHFDTAFAYGNEPIIGDVLAKWLNSGKINRDDLFIVTKLPMIGMKEELVESFVKKSLHALKLAYVDLYLVHQPIGLAYYGDDSMMYPTQDGKLDLDMDTSLEGVWRGMEAQLNSGRTKSIGISNFNSHQIKRIVLSSKIRPVVLQAEGNIFYQQRALREVCQKNGITFCAYAPLGSPGRGELYAAFGNECNFPSILEEPVVLEIGKTHGKTAAQVALRFMVQQNLVVIPKSVNKKRLEENLDILNFRLSEEDMKRLEGLDKGDAGSTFEMFLRINGAELHPENPLFSIS